LHALFEIGERDSSSQKKEKIQERLHVWDLGDYEPFLGSLLGLHYPEIEDLDPEKRKRKIFEGIGLVFDKSASSQPLALAFEDLQWGDSLSQKLLEQIVDKLGDKPIIICCDYRPELALPFIGQPQCLSLVLSPLDLREVHKLTAQLAEVAEVCDEVLHKIMERTEGNPLFIEEVVRHLLAGRLVRRQDQTLVPGKRFGRVSLPATVAGVMLGRIDRLPEEPRKVLQYAAVAGKEFDRQVLAEISQLPDDRIQNSLDSLEHFEGLLYSKQAEGRKIYEFSSTTTYEVAYGTLLKTRRRELHGRVGLILEKAYQENLEPHLEELAHHYYFSGLEDRAAHYSFLAGEKARRLYANKEALDYYQRAIGIYRKLEKAPKMKAVLAEALCSQGHVFRLIGQVKQALRNYRAAVRLARGSDQPGPAMKYLLEAAIVYDMLGKMAKARGLIESVLKEARQRGDRQAKAKALTNLANIMRMAGKTQEAIESANEALSLFSQLGDERNEVRTLGALAQTFEMMGRLPEAIHHYQRALDISRKINYRQAMASYHNNIGNPLLMMGRIGEAKDNFEKALEISHSIGDARVEMLASGSLGIVNAILGRYRDAGEFFDRSLRMAGEIEDRNQMMLMEINLGCLHQLWGILDSALEKHTQALEMAIELGDRFYEVEARRNLGLDYLYQGNYRMSREQLSAALELAQELSDLRMQSYIKANLGMLHIFLGDWQRADSYLNDSLSTAEQIADPEQLLEVSTN